jgi:hypothetical protein
VAVVGLVLVLVKLEVIVAVIEVLKEEVAAVVVVAVSSS